MQTGLRADSFPEISAFVAAVVNAAEMEGEVTGTAGSLSARRSSIMAPTQAHVAIRTMNVE